MLNLTVVAPAGPGFATVWPCGGPMPTASNINYAAGVVVANAVLAKVGVDGKVCVYTHAATDLVVDVNGFVTAGGGPAGTSLEQLVVRTDGSVLAGLSFDNMQPLAKRSAGLDGATVVFASRNGSTGDAGYAPIAPNEQCMGGYCSDLYVRDRAAGTTVSVTAEIEVGNQHPFSFWPFGYAIGTWAVSADHDTVLMNYACYGEFDWGSEIIGGTPVCGPDDPDDGVPLVLHRRSTGDVDVIGFEDAEAIDVSDDGSTALFADLGETPTVCFAQGWDCEEGSRLTVWRAGVGIAPVTSRTAFLETPELVGQLQVLTSVVSGDGEIVMFMASGWTIVLDTGETTEIRRLYRHVLDTGVTTEIPLSEAPQAEGGWWILDTDLHGEVVAVAFQEYVDDPFDQRAPRLFVIDVPGAAMTEVPGAACGQGIGSMTGDGRYVTCWRTGEAEQLGPAVVDLDTGAIGQLFPVGSPVDARYSLGGFISRSGQLAVARADAASGQDGEQLYAITLSM